ncbi:hypothetical protein [Streptomyces macrosporus]|uniref:Uncharacterized protein n=1 Tax=Streptomyces macrosporus TaxID=44032 RepID=A0ABN3KPQ0_9ACTN
MKYIFTSFVFALALTGPAALEQVSRSEATGYTVTAGSTVTNDLGWG